MLRNKKSMGRTIAIVAPVAAAALLLAGCAGGGSATSSKVAAIIKGLDNSFFQTMQLGIETQAKDDNVTVTVQAATGNDDTAGQADKLTALAGQDYGCFIVNPITGTNLLQALAPISKANKTIINIDSPLDAAAASAAGIKVNTYIGTDNKDAGSKAGVFVASKIAAGSKVALVGGISGNETSAARIDGFKAGLGSAGTVVTEVAADWNREKALTAATDIIAANPDVAAFFAANDDMGLGIVKAVENAGKTGQIVVVSVDGNKDALESVKAGGLTATVAQYPFAVGSLGVQACQVAAAGKTLPANVVSPTALVSADKADAAIAAFPQPFEPFANPLADLLK